MYAHRTLKRTAGIATNVTDHRRAFDALTRGVLDNFALFSVLLNEQPAAAIAVVAAHEPKDEGGDIESHIEPLFVSIADAVVVTHHNGCEA